jgi:competence protein ComEC
VTAPGSLGEIQARIGLRIPAWLGLFWHAEAPRRPLWLAVAFGSGTAVYFTAPDEPTIWLPLAFAGPGLAVLLTGASPFIRAMAWLSLMFALGFCAALLRVAMADAPSLSYAPPRVEGEACIAKITPRASFTQLKAGQWSAEAGLPAGFAANLRWRSPPPDLRAGERIRVSVRLFPVDGPIYPGSYDPRRIAFFERIGGEGWIGRTTERIGLCRGETWIEQARHWFRDRLLASVDGPPGGLLVGVTTGWRGDIPREQITAMREAGLGHLLAISGLHVGLVVGLVLFAARAVFAAIPALVLHYPVKKWAAAAGLTVGLAYLAFSGGSVPTQRAMIMLGLVLIALLFDRIEVSMRPVAWAAVIVLALSPEAILSPSFHLSFAAVIGLVAVFETWRRHRNRRGEIGYRWPWAVRYLAGVSATTLIATFATMPFAAFHFHQIALMSLLANLVAVPLFAFVLMPALLVGTVLLPFGLESLSWQAAGFAAEAIFAVGERLTGWPGAVAKVGPMPEWGIGLMVMGGLWWAIWQERWRWAGLVAGAFGLIAPFTVTLPDMIIGERHVAFFDGGEGYWLQGRKGFVPYIWSRETGAAMRPLPESGSVSDANGRRLSCDKRACLLDMPGGRLAAVTDPEAEAECLSAVFAVAHKPVSWDCTRWPRYGETWLVWLEDGKPRIESSWPDGRPWN